MAGHGIVLSPRLRVDKFDAPPQACWAFDVSCTTPAYGSRTHLGPNTNSGAGGEKENENSNESEFLHDPELLHDQGAAVHRDLSGIFCTAPSLGRWVAAGVAEELNSMGERLYIRGRFVMVRS